MGNKEKEAEKNPYHLSAEELMYPGTRGKEWVDQLAVLQREGIDQGFCPQLPRGLPPGLMRRWRNRVWNYYLSILSEEERRVIKRTVELGEEYHITGR